MKELHYGEEYVYSHDHKGHFVDQEYLPKSLMDKIYYKPTELGTEKAIGERLNLWWNKRRRIIPGNDEKT